MSAQHTPGPWFLAEEVKIKHTITNLRRIRSERERMNHGAVCEVYGIADGSEAHANSRLIAAAPDLLKALISLRAAVLFFTDAGEDGDDWPEVQAATDAIVKATGGNP